MTDWSTLIGQDHIREWFSVAIEKGRLAGSFLFVGQHGVGKQTVATLLARTLLCEKVPAAQMSPCGTCEACVQVGADTHPDLIRQSKPADKNVIPVELLIGPADARMQQGFCRDVRLKPFRGRRKVAILEDADFLNEEGANCLLKTLEEPPANAVILLIGTSEQRQLPTIRSRCQTIRFRSPSGQNAVRLLRDVHGVEADDAKIGQAVETSGGDMQVALRLLGGDSEILRETIGAHLGSPHPDPVALQRIITKHVDQAGKDARVRRGAMRDVFSMAIQHYRHQLRQDAGVGGPSVGGPSVGGPSVGAHTLARLDRSLRALREVDRSANQSTLIECYAADIAAGTTGDRGEIG